MNERLLNALETARAMVEAYPREAAIAAAAGLTVILLLLALVLRARRARRAAELPEATGEAAAETESAGASAPAAEPVQTVEAEGLAPEREVTPPPPAPQPLPPEPPQAPPEPEPAPPAFPEPAPPEPPESLFQRLRRGLARTQDAFVGRLDAVFSGREKLDDEAFDEIEEILYTADLGVATATRLMETLRDRAAKGGDARALREALQSTVEAILAPDGATDGKAAAPPAAGGPQVVMFVGVNGVGKTTTIGKVGARCAAEGKKVMLAAADTFRAAAIEQLEIWGERIGAPVVKQAASSDPSAVAFDAVAAAKSRGVDVLLVDTAGRLHTKVNLMEELKKMKRILGRELPGAPHEVILVLDATTGQNALSQARQFNDALGVTGIALTKLDGTAKGGIVIAVHEELGLPIRYIGVGEKVDDLRPFDAHSFVEALFTRE